jgi:flagellar protein FlaG
MQISNVNLASSVPQVTSGSSRQNAGAAENQEVAVSSQTKPVSEVQTERAVKEASPESDAKSLEDSVKKMNEAIQSMQRDVGLEFSIDDTTNIKMVKVMDIASKEVIRMIPGTVVIDIAKAIDKFQGLLLRDKA